MPQPHQSYANHAGQQRPSRGRSLAVRLGLLALIAIVLAGCAPNLSSFALTDSDIPVPGFVAEKPKTDELAGSGQNHNFEVAFNRDRPCTGNTTVHNGNDYILQLIIWYKASADAKDRYDGIVATDQMSTLVDKLKTHVSDPQIGDQASLYTEVNHRGELVGYHLTFYQGHTVVELIFSGTCANADQLVALGQIVAKRIK